MKADPTEWIPQGPIVSEGAGVDGGRMKLLLVSDMHYRLRQYDWVYDAALDVDVVVIAGDLLDIRSAVPLPAQVVAVSAQIGRIGGRTVLLAASGNHDLNERDEANEKVAGWLRRMRSPGLHVDGESLLIGTTLFTICPWWDGPNGQRELAERFEVDAARDKERWVWVYHAPPRGSPLSWDGRREFGDQELSDWIQLHRPDMVLTGHIHQAPFVDGGGWADQIGDTWIFNAGQQPGPMPSRILIDLEAGHATWLSATDRETVTFGTS